MHLYKASKVSGDYTRLTRPFCLPEHPCSSILQFLKSSRLSHFVLTLGLYFGLPLLPVLPTLFAWYTRSRLRFPHLYLAFCSTPSSPTPSRSQSTLQYAVNLNALQSRQGRTSHSRRERHQRVSVARPPEQTVARGRHNPSQTDPFHEHITQEAPTLTDLCWPKTDEGPGG